MSSLMTPLAYLGGAIFLIALARKQILDIALRAI